MPTMAQQASEHGPKALRPVADDQAPTRKDAGSGKGDRDVAKTHGRLRLRPGPHLGRELAVDLATGSGCLVENQNLGAGQTRLDGCADSRRPRADDDDVVGLDGGGHRGVPFDPGLEAGPKPRWVSTTIPARAGTRHVRTLASPSTIIRQS